MGNDKSKTSGEGEGNEKQEGSNTDKKSFFSMPKISMPKISIPKIQIPFGKKQGENSANAGEGTGTGNEQDA